MQLPFVGSVLSSACEDNIGFIFANKSRLINELIIPSEKKPVQYCLEALSYHPIFPGTVWVSLVAVQHVLLTAEEAKEGFNRV